MAAIYLAAPECGDWARRLRSLLTHRRYPERVLKELRSVLPKVLAVEIFILLYNCVMSSASKCQNFTGCLSAYRGEEVRIAPGEPAVCPECGGPLVAVEAQPAKVWKVLPWAAAFVVLVIAAVFLTSLFSSPKGDKAVKASDTPVEIVPATPDAKVTPEEKPVLVKKASPTETHATPPPAVAESSPPAEPVAGITRPAQIDLDLAKLQNKEVRTEVLKRIDLMPKVSLGNKDKLYNSVERARSMGLILTIPFTSGTTALSTDDLQALKTELEKPEITKYRDDPTAVFVILGYADPKGDEKKNIEISQKRADGVLEAMRDKCGVANIMHAVAMGGQKLLDSDKLEKNRVVEIWIALP